MTHLNKKHLSERNYKIAVLAITFGLAALTKTVAKESWKAITSNEPPENPEDQHYNTTDVILFTASVGLIGAMVKVYARKHFSQIWKQWGGTLPKHLN